MICPVYKTENAEGSQFCVGCGIQLEAGLATMPETFGLASRGARLFAVMVDGITLMALLIIGGLISPFWGPIAFGVFMVVQVILLTKDGQTVGKKVLGIRIVKRDTGQNGGFVTNVLLRLVVNGALGLIPLYGIVDALFIFRQDCRCIHDFIAGTKVVTA